MFSVYQPGSLELNGNNSFPFQLPSLAAKHLAHCRARTYEMGGWGIVDFFLLMWQRIFICLHWNSTEAACGSNLTLQIKVSCMRKVATKLWMPKLKLTTFLLTWLQICVCVHVITIEVACLGYTVKLGYMVYVSEYTVCSVYLLMHGLLCQICIHSLVICVSAFVCVFAYMFAYALHLFVHVYLYACLLLCPCVYVCFRSVHTFKKRQTW